MAIAAIPRAGLVLVHVNLLCTARELPHRLHDSGARAVILLEDLAATLAQVAAEVQVHHVVVAAMGHMPGVKGQVVNHVVRKVKKRVPHFHLPHPVRFKTALTRGGRPSLQAQRPGPDELAVLQYTGTTTGLQQGRDALAPQPEGQHPAVCSLVRPGCEAFTCQPAVHHGVYAADPARVQPGVVGGWWLGHSGTAALWLRKTG